MPEPISGRVRGVFRDWASAIVLRDIDRLWQSEGFAPGFTDLIGGQRVTRWAEYEATVSWGDSGHVRRVRRVYESVITEFPPPDGIGRFERVLQLDGWSIDATNHIVPTAGPVSELSGLEHIRGADGIHEAFRRIGLLLERDPPGVVAASKELIEATAKTVLTALDQTVNDDEDFPALISRAQLVLGLSAARVESNVDTAPSVRRILGGLTSVALGITELRNAEGGGHGRARGTRLVSRHARLAFNAARTWCELVLDTLADEAAPWRASNRSD